MNIFPWLFPSFRSDTLLPARGRKLPLPVYLSSTSRGSDTLLPARGRKRVNLLKQTKVIQFRYLAPREGTETFALSLMLS